MRPLVARSGRASPIVVAAAAAALALTACGGGGGGTTTKQPSAANSPPPTATSTASATSSASSSAAAVAPTAANGRKLYTTLSCNSCHSIDGSKALGPTWKGLYGSKVKITGAKAPVVANSAYLTSQILSGGAECVAGYQCIMRSGAGPIAGVAPGSVSASQAQALVKFIKTLK